MFVKTSAREVRGFLRMLIQAEKYIIQVHINGNCNISLKNAFFLVNKKKEIAEDVGTNESNKF